MARCLFHRRPRANAGAGGPVSFLGSSPGASNAVRAPSHSRYGRELGPQNSTAPTSLSTAPRTTEMIKANLPGALQRRSPKPSWSPERTSPKTYLPSVQPPEVSALDPSRMGLSGPWECRAGSPRGLDPDRVGTTRAAPVVRPPEPHPRGRHYRRPTVDTSALGT